jgi:hypothetical protein
MPKIDPDDYVTVTHAAEIAGVSREWARKKAQDGTVRAVCIDGYWFIHKDDALKLATANRR